MDSLPSATEIAAFPKVANVVSGVAWKIRAAFSVLLLASATLLHAQSALDGFDPNANDTIWVVVVQPDGKILLGGDFTTLSPNGGGAVSRNHIARLNADGTLDTAFNPGADGRLHSIAVQPDGKILVGGTFTNIGGQPRNHFARLDASTGLPDSFDPNSDSDVHSIVLQADGHILVRGTFTNIGGQPRNYIARLDPTTGLADSFNPNANNFVLSMAVQADGKVVAGGAFTNIGGQPRTNIARLDPATGLADSFNPNVDNEVFSVAVQADGKILIAGYFNVVGIQTRNHIARLDPTTGLADSFDPNASGPVVSVAVQADGRILAAGDFTNNGGQTRNNVARLDPATGLADSFDPTTNSFGLVRSIAEQADGRILVGGEFTTLAPNGGTAVTRNRIARLEKDGRLDRTLNLNIGIHTGVPFNNPSVDAIAVQPDGKILIGGTFTSVLGVPRHLIARVNTDGTLDTAFDPNGSGDFFPFAPSVDTIAVQADGKILVGGKFSNIGGQPR